MDHERTYTLQWEDLTMKKLMMGLIAVFALSTVAPAFAGDDEGGAKKEAKKPAKKGGKKAPKKDADKPAE